MVYVNGRKLNIEKFPNNEVCIRDYIDLGQRNEITLKFESNEDILNLMFFKKHLDEKVPTNRTTLNIYYLPYSRMDRTEGTNVFTLKYLCQIINALNFEKVLTYEAHSNVSLALLDRVENVNYSVDLANKCMKDISFDKSKDFLVFPDDGAKKRYANDFKGYKFLTCTKKRDFLSGRITSLEINEEITGDFKAIIVDDLCSYGGTFVMASEALSEKGASEIYLCITHSEDGLFKGNIFKDDVIDRVYTTDSILDMDRIKQIPYIMIDEERIDIQKL